MDAKPIHGIIATVALLTAGSAFATALPVEVASGEQENFTPAQRSAIVSGQYDEVVKTGKGTLKITSVALRLGRHEIDGDDAYANVMEVELKRWSADATLEAHHAYIDVHMPISGEETVGYAYDERCRTAADFNVKDDYCLVKNAKMRPITLKPGQFAAFFPACGAHAPNQIFGESRRHKKLVVKVRA